MSTQLTFHDFLNLLPPCPGLGALPTLGDDPSLPGYVTKCKPEFIPPHLTRQVSEDPLEGGPQVVVVSAPGAVGKSTLAHEVSYEKHAPLWDLSQYDRVARDTLNGALFRAFGFTPAVQQQLAAGKLFFVIDALDEGRIKAGSEAAFLDFLDDVGKVAKSAPGVAFVLLGRTRIAEDSWLALNELGARTSLYSIGFFDEAQRTKYLDLRLQRRPVVAKHIVAHRTEFEKARDLLFSQLENAIDSSGEDKDAGEAAAFLGYAPVLEAIAVMFEDEEQDYNKLANKLRDEEQGPGTRTGSKRMHLLRAVVEQILHREQDQKLLHNLKRDPPPHAPKGWGDWKKLYTPAEQRARLLARIVHAPWTPPLDLPTGVRQWYEEKLKSFFDEHPFLREAKSAASIVFEAYLLADALVDPSHPLREQLPTFIERGQALSSRLLADFYFFFRSATNQPIPLAYVGFLYGSLLSGETESRRLHLELDAGDPEPDEWEETQPSVEFEWMDPTAEDPDADLGAVTAPLRVGVEDRLTFHRTLKDASITLPSTARLDTSASEFVIGPEVQIRAKRLEISNAETLIVKGPKADVGPQPVVLEALSAGVASVHKVTCYGVLSVSWPGCRVYPWTYATEPAQDIKSDSRLMPVYRRFRRIAMAFRSRKKGQLARIQAKINNPSMLQGALGQALLGRLLEDHILYPKGVSYFWDPATASQLVGVSWQDLRRGLTPPKLIGYLRQFADAHQELLKPV